jgi:hypothetical protein
MAAVPSDAAPDSMLASLRRLGEAQRAEHTTEVAVGGEFGERLVVRYGVLAVDEMERYTELVSTGSLSNLGLAIDCMVACCRSISFIDDRGETVLLSDERGPVKLGPRLAALMGWESIDGAEMKPRTVVKLLFGDNAMALDAHLSRLLEWMRSARSDGPGGS